jgi:hypothetical protein
MQLQNLPATCPDTASSSHEVQFDADLEMAAVADAALLETRFESSDPDLYHAKFQFE